MRPGTEGEARIEAHDDGGGSGRGSVPAWDDPQSIGDCERRKLHLTSAHPIVVLDLLDAQRAHGIEPRDVRGLAQDAVGVCVVVEQHLKTIDLPGGGRVPVPFGKLRRLLRRSGMRVLDRDRDRARLEQGLGQAVRIGARELEDNRLPGHRRAPTSRPAAPR